MSATLKDVLQTKTKDELIDMYISLVEKPDDIYYELAITDPLTQVYNRRGAEAKFHELQINDNLDDKKLVFVDLDHFKHINDDMGHDWGDRALYEAAKHLKNYFDDDIIIRFGGDEFLVITNKSEDYINSFDKQTLSVNYQDEDLIIKCSSGYSNYHDNINLHDWIMEAEKCMFRNKHKRNLY